MAYERDDTRNAPRDEGSRLRDERFEGRDRSREERGWERERGYRPMTGDYGRSEQFSGGRSRSERGFGDYDRGYGPSEAPYGQHEYRRTSFAGSREREREFDPHCRSWRERHL